jgi:DNA (cytosine-5)-methyltransferase 1
VRLGSFCSGSGGLDLALAQVLDVEPVWHAENDPHAARVLAHHWPGIPNLGDITTVDWATVQPVEVVTAGYPCQPFSSAGRRQGVDDERHLWPHVAEAVRVLRPRLVFLENVAGHLTLGFGDVLRDLAALGYDASWRCLRASDVGAPHRRERVWIVAADARSSRCEGPEASGASSASTGRAASPAGRRRSVGRGASPADTNGTSGRRPGHTIGGNGPATPGGRGAPQPGGRGGLAADAERYGREGRQPKTHPRERQPDAVGGTGRAWGVYGPAIRRWERVLGRNAPAPTDATGRLSPPFVEWMLGLEPGWVTAVPDVPRTAQLRILGNGVVPQQGAAALGDLLAHLAREAA